MEEQKIVVKDKTFNDIAVQELADVKARLLMYKYYNCSTRHIPAAKRFEQCYSQLNEYDQLRVDNHAAELLNLYMMRPDGFMPYKALKRRYIGVFFIMFFFVFISLFVFGLSMSDDLLFEPFVYIAEMNESKAASKPRGGASQPQVEAMIDRISWYAHANACDVDHDNKVTCLDRALIWKIYWDYYYPEYSDQCIIVWNFDTDLTYEQLLTSYNHVYMFVFNRSVEPQSWNLKDKSIGPSCNGYVAGYNPRYDHYEFTQFFLDWLNCGQYYNWNWDAFYAENFYKYARYRYR